MKYKCRQCGKSFDEYDLIWGDEGDPICEHCDMTTPGDPTLSDEDYMLPPSKVDLGRLFE